MAAHCLWFVLYLAAVWMSSRTYLYCTASSIIRLMTLRQNLLLQHWINILSPCHTDVWMRHTMHKLEGSGRNTVINRDAPSCDIITETLGGAYCEAPPTCEAALQWLADSRTEDWGETCACYTLLSILLLLFPFLTCNTWQDKRLCPAFGIRTHSLLATLPDFVMHPRFMSCNIFINSEFPVLIVILSYLYMCGLK